MWRSMNGGASFQRVADSLGASGDSDVSISPDGTVYVSDLFNSVPVSISTNKATSFSFVSSSMNTNSVDRQWLATPANGVIFSGVNLGGTFRVAVSHDNGVSWSRHNAFSDAGFPPPGQLIAPTVNDVYIPYASGSGLGAGGTGTMRLAISHDGGVTWVSRNVGPFVNVVGLGGTALFPAVARDVGGNLYVVWADNSANRTVEGTRIRLAVSTNDGLSWSAPREISTPSTTTQGTYNIFPWVLADATGKVAVSWFEGVPPAGTRTHETSAALTQWSVKFAYSANANAPNPTWTSQAATGVVYTGPICLMGTGCVPLNNPVVGSRVLLDFFEMAETSTGDVVITYPGNQIPLASLATSSTQLYVVKQTGGANLK